MVGNKLRIIDGNNLLHREAHERVGYGVHPVRAVFARFCSPPETTVIVWDGPYANERRKKIYPKYKANRRPKEESKYEFFDMAKGVLRFTPIIQMELEGWEADDVIGSLIDRFHKSHQLIVETTDGDYWQHKDKCLLPLVSKKWHSFSAEDCLLYKALVGESKDNVSGIVGFGEISWAKLNREAKDKLIKAVKTDDFSLFCTIEGWPPKVAAANKASTFNELKLCWKLNESWQVSEAEIDAVLKPGTLNIAAAEIFMEGFLI